MAADLGVVGRLYPVAEADLLQTIRHRLVELQRSGELARLLRGAAHRARRYAARPPGLSLPRARVPRVYYLQPRLRLANDVYDHRGRVLHYAGGSVNPLRQRPLSRRLLLFDGDDAAQRRWAARQLRVAGSPARLILVNGSPQALQRRYAWRVYFDQYGQLAGRLGITALPAVVSQQDDRLRIEQVALDE